MLTMGELLGAADDVEEVELATEVPEEARDPCSLSSPVAPVAA